MWGWGEGKDKVMTRQTIEAADKGYCREEQNLLILTYVKASQDVTYQRSGFQFVFSDNNSIIIGVTVGVLFLILLLITIGLIVWRMR